MECQIWPKPAKSERNPQKEKRRLTKIICYIHTMNMHTCTDRVGDADIRVGIDIDVDTYLSVAEVCTSNE